ncbi:hypothetical protein MATL_G00200030 [Megalops atlanticus]|uniref:Ig-like domain-containing protein n=1 Tax=Megalops atlanticus TaxID=7932 RepID=A0A9D3PP70_MEGAT|nr:hypothetical protein MATL_G00200030 [Megalops atlanticus]
MATHQNQTELLLRCENHIGPQNFSEPDYRLVDDEVTSEQYVSVPVASWGFCSLCVGGVCGAPSLLSALHGGVSHSAALSVSGSGEQVVQVSWMKEHPDGSKEQIITAHRTEGHTEFGRFSGRVHFESSDPMENSALIIRSTEVSDEGRYTCHISTFPSGNFDTQLSLTVWTTPISSLEPVEMVEGQSFRVAATCRSVARPPPRLSWETELPGVAQNRSSEGGAVSTHFSLHPLRSMNGKRLDCLVWHPSMETPRRISNQLIVHYPPDATVRGYDGNWFVGLEGASLRCDSGGNPKPQSFTWTRRGGALPEGVTQRNDTLLFSRPLTLTDAGLYECVAKNSVGLAKADVDIAVSETARQEASFSTLMMLIVGVVAAVLVVALVISVIMMNRYHKRRNKKLEMELSEKKEEISTLSRQASFRRINSVSTDHRMQMEESVPLRVEGTLRTSLSSLGEQAHCRDSRSTLSGGRGGGGGGARFGSGSPSPPLSSPCPPPGGKEPSPPFQPHEPPLSAEEEEEEEREMERQSDREKEGVQGDQDSETTSSQISEVLSSRFQQSNGTLHPKPRLNDILLSPQIYHPKGQIV